MTASADPFDLERFVQAQDLGGTYDQAIAELHRGRKTSHWIWFVFPQIAGLGHSDMAQRYAIADLDEARAYVAHPVLGPRLAQATDALLALDKADPVAVLGSIDATKLRSSMTLFEVAAGADAERFAAVLDQYFAGVRDDATIERL